MLQLISRLALGAVLASMTLTALASASVGDVGQVSDVGQVGEAGADGGAERWRAGDHMGALSLWTSQLERGREVEGGAGLSARERSRLAYNLGVAEYERDEPLRAVAWFEASLRAAPRNADARVNLGIARAEVGLEPRTADDLTGLFGAIAASVSRPESEWLAVLGALLLALAGLGEALRGGPGWRRVVLLALVAQPLLFAPLVRHLATAGAQPYMVIDPDGARTRSAPSTDADRLGTIAAGSIVEYIDELPGWTKVMNDGQERWVEAGKLFDLRL